VNIAAGIGFVGYRRADMVVLVLTVIVRFLLKFNLYPTKDGNIGHDTRNTSVRPSYIKVYRRKRKINVTEPNQQRSFAVLYFILCQ
jgi:hypothetical protein